MSNNFTETVRKRHAGAGVLKNIIITFINYVNAKLTVYDR